METRPQISVCMAMYNASLYLRECIDSILTQTFGDFELLIVDDGSEDDSVAIVQSYNDSRIRLFCNQHDYIESLNMLLREARGEYIARMDADDVMMPYRLELQIGYMKVHRNIDILGGAIQYFGKEEGRIVAYKSQIVTAGDLLNGNVLSHPTVMMRASSVTGLYYDPHYIYAEDYQFWCQAFKAGLKITNIQDVVTKYRIGNTNVSSIYKKEQCMAALKAKAELEEWITTGEAGFALPAGIVLPPSTKELTVILTFLNEGEELEKTVAGIRRTVGDTVEIIVINDCSFDGYAYGEVLIPHHVHYIVNRHRLGVAASRDLGVSLCRTPFFLLLDAHMRFYDSYWADRIVEELRADERQLICCQGRFLYKDEATGSIKEFENQPVAFGAYSPFRKDAIWPDIIWNYKETHPGQRTEDIPTVLGAAYAASKTYWHRLRGLKGLHNYGADEQFIGFKVWREGGRCTLLKDVVIGHIYRKQAPYLILGRDSVYNLMFIAKLLFPASMYSETVATALMNHRDFAQEALETFKTYKEELDELKTYLESIFVREMADLLPMHQICRAYNSEAADKVVSMLPDIVQHLQNHVPVDDGLMEGKTGALLWLLHYEAFAPGTDIDEIATTLYAALEADIKAQRLSWNFRYGLAGIGWGLLYLYCKGYLNIRPDTLIDSIDAQLLAISPETMDDMSLDTGITGILAYLTLRLTAGRPELPALPLEKWYKKALHLFMCSNQREIVYYAHFFCSIYEEGPYRTSPIPLLGVWLSAPSHLPKIITPQNCTLADGVLGTTLQTMLLTRTPKNPTI